MSSSANQTVNVTDPANELIPPVASFTTSVTAGDAPLKVVSNASASSDADGKIVKYRWNFGDQSTGKGKKVNHTFDTPGIYAVTLTVTDDDGLSDSSSQTLVVTEPGSTPTTFPIKLRARKKDRPEEVTVNLNVDKPSKVGATATLTMKVFDADVVGEGSLQINNHAPIKLFGKLAKRGNNDKTVPIALTTPSSFWKNGENALRFVHTATAGYEIESGFRKFQSVHRSWIYTDNLSDKTASTQKRSTGRGHC